MRTKWIVYELTEVEITKRSFAQCFKLQIKSPAQAGFDSRGEAMEQGSESNKGAAWVRFTEFAPFASTKVKLIRAQGECLGIRSR